MHNDIMRHELQSAIEAGIANSDLTVEQKRKLRDFGKYAKSVGHIFSTGCPWERCFRDGSEDVSDEGMQFACAYDSSLIAQRVVGLVNARNGIDATKFRVIG